ncbi:Acetyltransferase (GNAT) family [Carex littledalei]|uniref:Acetyltransferase (GNAT) family n=1 Tax=Carex littledalei TaxID=544730 RepID=A0A833W399_9POAL|nr:Acetyltransferase (GNAT) family [Carex littledalei]
MASTLSLSPKPPIQLLPQKKQFKSQNLFPLTRSLISFYSDKKGNQTELLKKKHFCCVSTPKQEVDVVGKRENEREIEYLVREFGWGVRKLHRVGEEVRMAAYVQAEAFYEPMGFFNGFFYEFFKAEVLADLMIRMRNSATDRYACLVAESINESTALQEIVGVVDITVQRDEDVLVHLNGTEEYLYISGIAVLKKFRRQKVGTVLIKACDALSHQWRYNYLALRAYEDDLGARRLYSSAGYSVVARDPLWWAMLGMRRRVLMIKQSNLQDLQSCLPT